MLNNKEIGICPKCGSVIRMSKKSVVMNCPECTSAIVVNDAVSIFEDMCSNPAYLSDTVEIIDQLVEDDANEMALEICAKLAANHPHNEGVAYLHVETSGFDYAVVRDYLSNFAAVGGVKEFASEFMDHVLDMRYMMLVPNLIKFVENKVPAAERKVYREKLEIFREEYLSGAKEDTDGMALMFFYYTVLSIVNVGLLVLFLLVDMKFIFNIIISLGVFMSEFFLIFLHNHMYGNRLEMSKTERIFLLVFLCTIPIAVAGVVIGALN